MAEWYAFEPIAETSIGVLAMFHSGGMSGAMNVLLYAGATLLLLSRFWLACVAHTVGGYRATRLFGVPTMFIALLNHEDSRRADFSSLRACRTNAAPLPPSVKTAFDELVGREGLVEGYGLTETSPLTHANPIHHAKAG
jgi:long-chain acyl-CoA synthetase